MQIIKIKRGGKNTKASGAKGVRHYTAQIVANAMAMGWLNGVRLNRKAA